MTDWAYFVYGLIFWQICRMLYMIVMAELKDRRERQFLKAVNVEFPEHVQITFISVAGSDRKALNKIKQDIYKRFELEEGQEGIMRESREPWPE
jgi:hypothetical protein